MRRTPRNTLLPSRTHGRRTDTDPFTVRVLLSRLRSGGIFAALITGFLMLPVSPAAAAPPSNDDYANASELVGPAGTVSGNIDEEVTDEVGEYCTIDCGGSVWYRWTPAISGTNPATFDLCSQLGFDTVLAVYRGQGATASTLVVRNDDGCPDNPGLSTVTFDATFGVTYHIRVAGFAGANGPYTLSYPAGGPIIADTTGPVLNVPADMTVTATSPAGATVTYTVSADDAVDGPTPVTCTPPSGSTFAVGATQVTCSSTDSSGNTTSDTFMVTVNTVGKPDRTAPVLKVPSTIQVKATSNAGATVTYTATAKDAVDGPTPVTCSPPSGAMFAVGATKVTCSSTDSSGNTATKKFIVHVKRP
jgi:hypothetical protein